VSGTNSGLGPRAPPGPGLLFTVKLLRVLLVFTAVTLAITGPPGPPAWEPLKPPELARAWSRLEIGPVVYQNASLSGTAIDGALTGKVRTRFDEFRLMANQFKLAPAARAPAGPVGPRA
jgi:hypothetical protein